MNITQKNVWDKFDKLPEDIKSAITDQSVSYNLEQLGIKYGLRVDKIGFLVKEAGFVMLGLKKSADFVKTLSRELEIDRETAESLAIDVDNEVFRKIRESLRTVQFSENSPETAPVADPEYGHSPARDSLLQEVERHGNDDVETTDVMNFASSNDYSAGAFGESAGIVQTAPAPTPFEQATATTEEEKMDPTKTFKDHLEKKMEGVKAHVNADPYKESID